MESSLVSPTSQTTKLLWFYPYRFAHRKLLYHFVDNHAVCSCVDMSVDTLIYPFTWFGTCDFATSLPEGRTILLLMDISYQ